MIAFVEGTVAAAGPDGAVVEVGGVGLSVRCTPAALAGMRVGDRARVPTTLVVREDSLTLYGFTDDDERSVFELLQTAGGVGPRLALAMLAVHTPNSLRRAVAAGDITALTKVPGIGRKGAQRIVLELKDRLGLAVEDGRVYPPVARAAPWRDQVHTGLTNLGWSTRDADAAVEAVAAEVGSAEPPEIVDLLKMAMKRLGR